MDVSRSILIQRHRLEKNILATGFRLVYINKFEKSLPFLKDIGVALLADFTFKFLPIVRGDVLSVLFYVSLGLNPILKAFIVDITDRTCALAG